MEKKKIPFFEALSMLFGYAKKRVVEQLKSVAFIILYLVVFQTIILGVPLANALATAGGIALVVFGLAFFLEGLILGLMPIGERVGVKLPTKVGILIISIFGIILGFGATFAEPAISALRAAGATITAWDSPLLYMILDSYTDILVISVGVGVGLAVALGMCRFYFNWSIKPIIYTVIPILLLLTFYVSLDENLSKIIGLAWDCGAVTTGAVTVPLVLALGIGVSRASNKGSGSSGGFGIIMLASAFPVLAVLILGIILNMGVPKATDEVTFFKPENKEVALKLFGSEDRIVRHAFTHGSEEGRKAYFETEAAYYEAIVALKSDDKLKQLYLGDLSLVSWLIERASEDERNLLADVNLSTYSAASSESFGQVLEEEGIGGLRAVLPLSFLLLLVLLLFLKERLRYRDEVALGIGFTLIGMILLTSGIRLGLASLGSEVGGQLPKAFATKDKFLDRTVINDFDESLLFTSITQDGSKKTFFNVYDNNQVVPVEFVEEQYDESKKQYTRLITQKPLFSDKLTYLGIVLVLLFVFGMGYGATLAEPALRALGMTVESLTVGAIKQKQIVQVVSVGVGTGIVLGMSRILFDIPLEWLLIPSYVLLIILSYFSEEEFTAIAWDSGGVTTGPVTVPLVLAMGLSIGGVLNVSDGFGILAMASAYPIITVLLYGLYVRTKQIDNLNDQSDE